MLRYKTETRPGFVAKYDIRPGNVAGLFLQPRSPHGAFRVKRSKVNLQGPGAIGGGRLPHSLFGQP